ncbi:MAG: 2-amino-4-hydroxy-6-hydroxymethyldihydropteridine diphosphokinase [Bacteroidota bacterium]
MKDVFILLGSNRGDRQSFIAKALAMIKSEAGTVTRMSALYETEPWGFDDSTPFLNQVVEIETKLAPDDLLEKLLTIEAQLGRIRPFDGCGCGVPISLKPGKETEKNKINTYSGRTIDLDILFYNQRLVFTDRLMVPHPRLHERKFTLVPLNEIAAEFLHPLFKKTISKLLHECKDQSKVTVVNL